METSEGAGQELRFELVTPGRLVADTSVSMVTLPGVEGEFGVLPGHMPFLTMLRPGVVKYDEGGMPRQAAVSGGIVEVTQGKVLALAQTCELSGEIDAQRAGKAKEEAESALAGMSHDDEQWAETEAKLSRAVARLSATDV